MKHLVSYDCNNHPSNEAIDYMLKVVMEMWYREPDKFSKKCLDKMLKYGITHYNINKKDVVMEVV